MRRWLRVPVLVYDLNELIRRIADDWKQAFWDRARIKSALVSESSLNRRIVITSEDPVVHVSKFVSRLA